MCRICVFFLIFIRVSYSSVSRLIWVNESNNFLVICSQTKKNQFTCIASVRYTELNKTSMETFGWNLKRLS